jgi:glycosyltransferase involved in cell wall biosynthesis
MWRILAVIRSVKPDLIQTWFHQMDVFGGVVAMIARVPFILSERSSSLAYPPTWKNWLRLRIGRRAAAIVANSEGGAAYWAAQAHSPRVEVIRNGLPLNLIQAAVPADPALLGLPSGARLILFAGRLSPEKNLDTLMRALDNVLAELPDCAALLFGEGILQEEVESRSRSCRSGDRIRLQPFSQELWGWMRCAGVFVSISRFEGNPNTILEAMAIGCPLVVSDIPQHREILDDTTALFCNPSSVADVSAAIRRALGDPAATNRRVEAAYRRSAQWSIEKSARHYHRLYEMLIRERAAAA